MKIIHLSKWLIYTGLLCILSCNSSEKDTFIIDKIFGKNEGVFRGVSFGMNLNEIKKNEDSSKLVYDDENGLVYELNLDNDTQMELNYFKQSSDTTNTLVSISANITSNSEKSQIEIFKAIELHINKKYGVSDGTFGNLEWQLPDSKLHINLKIQNNKLGILLSFSQI